MNWYIGIAIPCFQSPDKRGCPQSTVLLVPVCFTVVDGHWSIILHILRVYNGFAVDIETMSWEGLAADRTEWRSALKQHLETGEEKLMAAAADKRARRKEGSSSIRPETTHRCDVCNRDCHSRIGLFSHKRRCSDPARNNKIKKQKTKSLGCTSMVISDRRRPLYNGA